MYILKSNEDLKVGEYLAVELVGENIIFSKKGNKLGLATVKDSNIFKNRKPRAVVRESSKGEYSVSIVRFADLHRHSGYSLLDGAAKTKDIAELTEYAGALTDHGTMSGFLHYYKDMKAVGKQPIVGFEAYVETIAGEKESNHLVLLAKNQIGYKNLIKLTSLAYDNFYRRPHVSYEMLEKHNEGLIVLSGCLGGEIPRAINRGDYDYAKEVATKYRNLFGDDFYIEIQNHNIGEEEESVNKGLIKLSKEMNIKLVATTDSHYAKEEDKEIHEILLALQTGRTLSDEKRMRFQGDGYHIQTADEIEKRFSNIPEAIDNTLEIAEKCSGFELELGEIYLPKFEVPEGYTESSYFEYLTQKGFEDRFKGKEEFDNAVYKERLKHEIDTIEEMGYAAYFLIVWDFIDYAKRNGIMVGPGRGSAAGSLVSFCLHITDIDPIPYGLLFERFLNPERVSMPDIDVDFCYERREEVIQYVQEKYGEEAVSGIVTFGTFAARGTVRDVARVMDCDYSVGDRIAKSIPEKVGMTISDALVENPELKAMYDNEQIVKKVIDTAMKLEGLPRHSSKHACFTEDTLINTSDGLKRIIEVEKGDKVFTHNNRYMPVVGTMKTETDTVYEVKAVSSFPIKVTGNHPVLVREVERVADRSKVFKKPEWKSISELEELNHYLGIPINKESIIPENDYDLPFTSDSFWWLMGRYIGDGWTEAKTRNGKISHEETIVISCPKIEDEIRNIENVLIELDFNYRLYDTRTVYKFVISEPELFDYVLSFGQYAYGKKLNQDIINLPRELLKIFIEGYISADGSYNRKENRHSASTVSKELAMGLMQVIHKAFRRPVNIAVEKAGKDTIEGRIVNRRERYLLYFSKDERQKDRNFYEDDYIWSSISDIKAVEDNKTMYNLTVLDDSSYTANNIAVHNCGVIISDGPVDQYLPEFMAGKKDEKSRTSQVTMSEVEELGLLKMDFLGLKTMSIIGRTIESINRNTGDNVKYLEIPFDDPYVYNEISKGKSYGVFQLESPGMRSFMTDLYSDVDSKIKALERKHKVKGFTSPEGSGDKDEFKNEMQILGQELFERLIAGVSLYRPGPMDYLPNYLEGMKNPKNIHYLTPMLEEILEPTYGTIVYQEQVMTIVQNLAGYSLGRADLVRRAMGKKEIEVMKKEKEYFIDGKLNDDGTVDVPGCVRNGIPRQIAAEIWEQMSDFSKYAFNKSHRLCGII